MIWAALGAAAVGLAVGVLLGFQWGTRRTYRRMRWCEVCGVDTRVCRKCGRITFIP